jgi:hypothetical protein
VIGFEEGNRRMERFGVSGDGSGWSEWSGIAVVERGYVMRECNNESYHFYYYSPPWFQNYV